MMPGVIQAARKSPRVASKDVAETTTTISLKVPSLSIGKKSPKVNGSGSPKGGPKSAGKAPRGQKMKTRGKGKKGPKTTFTRKKGGKGKALTPRERKETATAPRGIRQGNAGMQLALVPAMPFGYCGTGNRATPARLADEEEVVQKHFHGLTDFQIDAYLAKIGFEDIIDGHARRLKNVVAVKPEFNRFLISAPTDKEKIVRQPSSMTQRHWDELNLLRQQQDVTIFIFVSREYVHPSLLKKIGRNNLVPTEQEIRKHSSKWWVESDDNEDELFVLRPTHMALISIRGTKFLLHDCNKFPGLKHDENPFVQPFWDLMRTEAVPRIINNFRLNKVDVMPRYEEAPCNYSEGVANSCVLALLFVIEATAENAVIRDVNYCPALSQLYRDKVALKVGGLTDFGTYVRQNPDWLTLNQQFNFERLLTNFKNGIIMHVSELEATKADLLRLQRYMGFGLD